MSAFRRFRSRCSLHRRLFHFYFKTATIMLIVILRVAKRVILRKVAGRRIQTLHGFRDYARNDGEPRSFIA